jgi:hypothetical protein
MPTTFRFVDAEKALRAQVEDQVLALLEEVAQLKMDTIGQVRVPFELICSARLRHTPVWRACTF